MAHQPTSPKSNSKRAPPPRPASNWSWRTGRKDQTASQSGHFGLLPGRRTNSRLQFELVADHRGGGLLVDPLVAPAPDQPPGAGHVPVAEEVAVQVGAVGIVDQLAEHPRRGRGAGPARWAFPAGTGPAGGGASRPRPSGCRLRSPAEAGWQMTSSSRPPWSSRTKKLTESPSQTGSASMPPSQWKRILALAPERSSMGTPGSTAIGAKSRAESDRSTRTNRVAIESLSPVPCGAGAAQLSTIIGSASALARMGWRAGAGGSGLLASLHGPGLHLGFSRSHSPRPAACQPPVIRHPATAPQGGHAASLCSACCESYQVPRIIRCHQATSAVALPVDRAARWG